MHLNRTSSRWTGAALVALVLGVVVAGTLIAQERPSAVFEEMIEVSVINLEAVVTDRDGFRVRGLKSTDFRILVDGQEVPVEYFSEVRGGAVVAGADAGAGVPPALTPGQAVGTSFLVFVDEFFSIKRDKTQVLKALHDRIPGMQDGDQVAVVGWNGKELTVVSDWVSTEAEAQTAVSKAMDRPALGLQRVMEKRQYDVTLDAWAGGQGAAYADDPFRYQGRLGTEERQYANLLVSQLESTVGAAVAAMRGLPEPAGRKVMLVLSGGWPLDVGGYVGRSYTRAINERNLPNGADLYGPLSETANLLGYTLYTVDMPGLQSGSGVSADTQGPIPTSVSTMEFFMEGEIHNSLQYLAGETGGLALLNGGRIRAFSETREDFESYYWLGFSPKLTGEDVWRDLTIEVTNPDLRVRSRRGFPDMSPTSQIASAVQSALLFGPLDVTSDLTIEVEDVEKAGRGLVQGTVKVRAPASAFVATPVDGGYEIRADLFLAVLDSSGGRSEVPVIPLVFKTTKKPGSKDTLSHETVIKVRKKTERLAVAMRDRVSGKTLAAALTKGRK